MYKDNKKTISSFPQIIYIQFWKNLRFNSDTKNYT